MRAAHFPADPSSVRGFAAQPHVGLRQIPYMDPPVCCKTVLTR